MSGGKRIARVLSLAMGVLIAVGQSAHAGMLPGLQLKGQLGYELTGIAVPGGPLNPVSGSITLSNIPPGALIQHAFLYANDFVGQGTGGGSLDFAFAQAPAPAAFLGSSVPTSSDPVPIAGTFGYEIPLAPNSVTGNGTYNVQISQSFNGGNANWLALAC